MAEEKKSILDDIFKWGCPALIIAAAFLIFAFVTGYANMFGTNDNPGGPYGPGSSGSGGSMISGGQNIKEDCFKKWLQDRGFADTIIRRENGNKNSVDDYISYIKNSGAKFGVSPGLIASIIAGESSYDKTVTSKKGAMGLMQLMPGTAVQMGVSPSEAYNPGQNIIGGTKYLKFLNTDEKYGLNKNLQGKVENVVAAYNAGPGAVNKHKGIPPYDETQRYVKAVMGFYQELIDRKCVEIEQPNISTNGIHPNTQKLLNYIDAWNGYTHSGGECWGANNRLIDLAYPGGSSTRTSINSKDIATDHYLAVTPSDLTTTAKLLDEGKIVTWHINGEFSGEHWVIILKIEGNDITYLDNVGKKIYTKNIDTVVKSRKTGENFLLFGVSPHNDVNVRGQYYPVK